LIYKKIQVALVLFLVSFLAVEPSFSQRTKSSLSSGNQRRSEKGLKDSKYFFFFINPSVSNNRVEEEVTIFTEALRRDLIARIFYMKFAFDISFEEIKKSQTLLIELYRKVLIREINDSRNVLNEAAAEVLQSEDYMSKKYLALGYRSSKFAEKVMLMADNLPEKNFSVRLYEYVRAMKNVKMAKRYAVAALVEKRIPPDKKQRINYQDYDRVKQLIEEYVQDKKERYLTLHMDNYYKVIGEKSMYDIIMDDPGLENIPEYEQYRKEK